MKIYEEALAGPITVTGVDGVDKVVWRPTETYINEYPENVMDAIKSELRYEDPDYSAKEANGQVIVDELPLGYYIIVPDGNYETAADAVIPINLTNITPDKVVKSKAAPLSITKTADITNASVGDVVTFTVEGTISTFNNALVPNSIIDSPYARMYLADTMQGMQLTGDWKLMIYDEIAASGRLLYDSTDPDWSDPETIEGFKRIMQTQPEDFDAITIHGDRAEDVKSYMTNIMPPTAGNDSFSIGYLVNRGDFNKPFKLTYSAIVTDEAIRGTEGNTNDAMAIYFDTTTDGQGYEITTTEDQETVYTYDMNLLKYADGDTSAVLSGAQFALYRIMGPDHIKYYYKLTEDATLVDGKDLTGPKVTWVDIGDTPINQAIEDGIITAVASGQDGKAAFTGIPHDTYYLQEIKAPEGYNLMAEDKAVELAADAPADFEVQVENTGGALLPETGGPGTALFTMMGLLLMAGAAAIYLSHRKQQQ